MNTPLYRGAAVLVAALVTVHVGAIAAEPIKGLLTTGNFMAGYAFVGLIFVAACASCYAICRVFGTTLNLRTISALVMISAIADALTTWAALTGAGLSEAGPLAAVFIDRLGIFVGLLALKALLVGAGVLALTAAMGLKRAFAGRLETPLSTQLNYLGLVCAVFQTAAAVHNCIEILRA